jgi:hypothetical protein
MLSAVGKDTGILWFRRDISIDNIARMVHIMNGAAHDRHDVAVRSEARALTAGFTPVDQSDESLAMRRIIKPMSRALRIRSAHKSALAVLEVMYSGLSDSDFVAMLNRFLNRISIVIAYSCAGIVQAMEESSGNLHGFSTLLWESQKVVHSRPPPLERYSFRRVLPVSFLEEFRLGRVLCLPAFQRVLVWRENTRLGLGIGWKDVVFQLVGVSMLPL